MACGKLKRKGRVGVGGRQVLNDPSVKGQGVGRLLAPRRCREVRWRVTKDDTRRGYAGLAQALSQTTSLLP